MRKKPCELRYLPLFYDDISETVQYISEVLGNPSAALRLIEKTEAAINKRSLDPEAFRKYRKCSDGEHYYYSIKIGNYFVFYVVIDDVMEVRRFLYKRRNTDRLLR